MDSLTHLVAGVLTPLAFRNTPKRAAVIGFGIAVGELPDIDILFGTSPEALLTLHRGITHALIWQPVFVLIVVLPFYLWLHCRRSAPQRLAGIPPARPGLSPPEPGPDGLGAFGFGRMYLVALIAVCTHIYLDCMTTFGTQAFAPFSQVRVGFASMFIVDLLMTLPALTLLLLALRQPPHLVAIPGRQRPGTAINVPATGYAFYPSSACRLARIGLAWVLLYPLFSLSVNHITVAMVEPALVAASTSCAEESNAHAALLRKNEGGLLLMTEPFSPFVWKAILDEGEHWRSGTLRLWSPASACLDQVYAKPEKRLYESLKKQHPLFAQFETFAPLMVQRERPASSLVQGEHQTLVTEYSFVDLRYIMAPDSPARLVGREDPNFVLEARVNESGALLAYRFLQRGKNTNTPWVLLQ